MKQRFFIVISVSLLIHMNCTNHSATKSTAMKLLYSWNNLEAKGSEQVIASVSDFVITKENEIALLDFDARQLIFTTTNGKIIRRCGRKGQGPGEFLWPSRLFYVQDTLITFDPRGNRFQYFSSSGDYLFTKINEHLEDNPILYTADNRLIYSTDGFRIQSLIQEYDPEMNLIQSFGELESEPIEIYNFEILKGYTKKRKIPPALKNSVLLCESTNENIFAIHSALPVMKKYSNTGELLSQVEFDNPNLNDIRDHFYTANDSLAPYEWMPLRYWADCTPDENGGFYCLLNRQDEINIYHFNTKCELVEILHDTGSSARKIYSFRNKLWVYLSDNVEFRCYEI